MAAHGALHRDGDGEGTMATQRPLHDAFIDELRDACDAERQLTTPLPRLARAARSDQLRQAFEQQARSMPA
jgi:ferritin-like metal-binding protein YciE